MGKTSYLSRKHISSPLLFHGGREKHFLSWVCSVDRLFKVVGNEVVNIVERALSDHILVTIGCDFEMFDPIRCFHRQREISRLK